MLTVNAPRAITFWISAPNPSAVIGIQDFISKVTLLDAVIHSTARLPYSLRTKFGRDVEILENICLALN